MRGKAEKMGVKEIFIDDLREEFVKGLCLSDVQVQCWL